MSIDIEKPIEEAINSYMMNETFRRDTCVRWRYMLGEGETNQEGQRRDARESERERQREGRGGEKEKRQEFMVVSLVIEREKGKKSERERDWERNTQMYDH